jgi:hypothetical protein
MKSYLGTNPVAMKSKSKTKKTVGRQNAIKPQPSIIEPTTKDKDKALKAIIGMWKDRPDMQTEKDVNEYRAKLWRRKN